MDHSLSRMVISSIFFIHHKCPIQNCWKWDKTRPTNDTSLYMATYLGWRTELCCHHGLPETSLPLSGTSETVKHNTNKQSHISTRCILHVKTTEMYLHRVSTSVLNVNVYYNSTNGINLKTSYILLSNICPTALFECECKNQELIWISAIPVCVSNVQLLIFIIYSFISYFLAK